MAGPGTSTEDAVARDDAHLRSLGIKPELKRTLGFLSIFAVAFSYISVSTGTFTNQAVAFGVGGVAIFWAWPLVILGQTFVALNFAELSSHFPVAGSIYQWSKRLSNQTLGWFTGWIYFWAGVITVTAVAATVPLVLSTIYPDTIKLADPSPIASLDMQSFIGLVVLLTTTVINLIGVRLLSIINNIGVGAEIVGMVFFALILLFFCNNQPPSVLFDTSYTSGLADGNYFAVFLVGMFMALFVVYGFDTAGTFGEETVDASRQAPKGVLSSIWLSGIVGADLPPRGHAVVQGHRGGDRGGSGVRLPDRDDDQGQPDILHRRGDRRRVVPRRHPHRGLRLHPGHPGRDVRLMFSMGRDRRLPFGGVWGHVSQRFRTPANASVAVGVLAAIPFLVTGAGTAIYIAIAATGMIYISYFLCNLGVLVARRRGWPHKGAWFSLGSWGTIINILALIWGGLMIINIALWTDPSLFGVYGNDLRNTWSNPFINTFIKIGGTLQDQLPAWPVFETTVGAILVIGAVYYLVAQRGKLDKVQVEADAATGEAVIG